MSALSWLNFDNTYSLVVFDILLTFTYYEIP